MATETTQSESAVKESSFDEKVEGLDVEKTPDEVDTLKPLESSPISDSKDKEIFKEEETPDVKENEVPEEQIFQNEDINIEKTPEEPDVLKTIDNSTISDSIDKEALKEEETPEVKEVQTPKEQEALEGAISEPMGKEETPEIVETNIPWEMARNETLEKVETPEIEETNIPWEMARTETLEKEETLAIEETEISKEINETLEKQETAGIEETKAPRATDSVEVAESETQKEQDYLEAEETKTQKETGSVEVGETKSPKGTYSVEVAETEIPKEQDYLETMKELEPNKGNMEESLKKEAEATPDVTEENSAKKQETPKATQKETPKEEETPKSAEKENSNEPETYKDQLPAETGNENALKVVEEEKLSKEASESVEADRKKEVKLAEAREIPIPTVDHKSGAGGEESKTENVLTTGVHKAKDGGKLSLRHSTQIFRSVGSKMMQVMQKMKNVITKKSSNGKAAKEAS